MVHNTSSALFHILVKSVMQLEEKLLLHCHTYSDLYGYETTDTAHSVDTEKKKVLIETVYYLRVRMSLVGGKVD